MPGSCDRREGVLFVVRFRTQLGSLSGLIFVGFATLCMRNTVSTDKPFGLRAEERVRGCAMHSCVGESVGPATTREGYAVCWPGLSMVAPGTCSCWQTAVRWLHIATRILVVAVHDFGARGLVPAQPRCGFAPVRLKRRFPSRFEIKDQI